MPPEGSTEDSTLPTPYQGIGARGVNSLASKQLLTLLPPNTPFFRLKIDDYVLQELGASGQRSQVEDALNKIERAVMDEIEVSSIRVSAFEALRLLIVTGNSLLYLPDDGGMRVYRLDQYVVKRDPMGKVLLIITKEDVHPSVLPEEVLKHLKEQVDNPDELDLDKDKQVSLFTMIERKGDKWEVTQECLGVTIPDSQGTYPIDACPWIPLRWTSLVGEDYGRGLVEEYLGDLLTLEALTKALTEGAALAALVVWLVNPAGVTRVNKLSKARNGDFIDGRREDVEALQVDKLADFRVVLEHLDRVEQRLAHSFMLIESIQRDAERVTAEEIRTMAQQLEESLGGIYSILSLEFQLPLVNRIMDYMTKQRRLPELPEGTVKPAIVTGLEALGRGNDLEKLLMFMDTLEPIKDIAMPYIDARDYMTRSGTAIGIDTRGLIKSEEQLQQEQEMAQMEQVAMDAIPQMTEQLAKGVMTPNG